MLGDKQLNPAAQPTSFLHGLRGFFDYEKESGSPGGAHADAGAGNRRRGREHGGRIHLLGIRTGQAGTKTKGEKHESGKNNQVHQQRTVPKKHHHERTERTIHQAIHPAERIARLQLHLHAHQDDAVQGLPQNNILGRNRIIHQRPKGKPMRTLRETKHRAPRTPHHLRTPRRRAAQPRRPRMPLPVLPPGNTQQTITHMFVKVHTWMLHKWCRNYETAIVFAVVHQFTESGHGFFAGYRELSNITGIPKSKCKLIIESLQFTYNAIEEIRERINGNTCIIWRSNPDFCSNFRQ